MKYNTIYDFKKFYKTLCIVLVFLMMQPLSITKVFAVESKKTMTVLFTHDLHDHFLPSKVLKNGQISKVGGYSKLQSAIYAEKKAAPDSILVDAGDFSMGTLFQSIFTSDAPALKILGKMGYDAATLGNHEYDFRARGLAESLNTAVKSGEKLPQIVQSNIEFPTDKKGKLTKSLTDLKQAMQQYGIKDYTVIKRGNIKIGIFGIMGSDSASNAPMSEVKFLDAVESAKRVVKLLKEKEKVDLIVSLSHSGTDKNKSKSEDELLAKSVPDIDIIISGHTHTKLSEPIIVGKTIIASCGEYSENLGVIKVIKDTKNDWKIDSYKLRQINSTIEDDKDISNVISTFKTIIQQKYLDNFDMKFDEVLAKTPFNFIPTSEIGRKHQEDTLGNFISDSFIYAVKKAEGKNYERVAVAIVPSGTIRGSFVKGEITVSDAFTVSSLGIGKDRISGYPLISVYLTGKEIKTACEVDASITPLMSSAQLYMSGISYTFNPNRLIFNKITDAKFIKPDGSFEAIDDKKLYRVVTGLYSAQMLSVVAEKSFGLLSIVPKTKYGTPITDFESQIVKDAVSGRNNEVKEWAAIAEYLKSFDKVNGISQIPKYYSQTQGKKIVYKNYNIISILSNPNKIALGIYGIVIFFVGIVIFVIRLIVKRRKLKKINI